MQLRPFYPRLPTTCVPINYKTLQSSTSRDVQTPLLSQPNDWIPLDLTLPWADEKNIIYDNMW